MRDFSLILPCAGRGSRLGLLYPKEIQAIGPDRIFLDNSLLLAINAGINKTIIVTNKEKIRYFEDFIGDKRNGMDIEYVINERYDSLPGSILSGCQYDFFKNGVEHFVVALPDTVISNKLSLKSIIEQKRLPILGLFDQPAEKYDGVYTNEINSNIVDKVIVKKPFDKKYGFFQGTWGLIALNIDTVHRLFSYLVQAEPFKTGDKYLLGDLISNDCMDFDWNLVKIEGDYIDLGNWNDFLTYLNKLHFNSEPKEEK